MPQVGNANRDRALCRWLAPPLLPLPLLPPHLCWSLLCWEHTRTLSAEARCSGLCTATADASETEKVMCPLGCSAAHARFQSNTAGAGFLAKHPPPAAASTPPSATNNQDCMPAVYKRGRVRNGKSPPQLRQKPDILTTKQKPQKEVGLQQDEQNCRMHSCTFAFQRQKLPRPPNNSLDSYQLVIPKK